MYNVDTQAIQLITDHYYIQRPNIVSKIAHNGRTFYNKFERIDTPLTAELMDEHARGNVTIAHDLIHPSNSVNNIVFDYNGRQPERFWQTAQFLLREEGFEHFTAYETKTARHLHLYIHQPNITLKEAYQIADTLSTTLATTLLKEWRMFPTKELPREYNILILPYKRYAKEQGVSS